MTLLRRVVLIVLVALLPALGAEIYNQSSLRAAQRAELGDEALRQAREVAAELGRILDGTRNAMVALSAMPAIRMQDAPACAALLASIRNRFAFINFLALVDGHDRVVCGSLPPLAPSQDSGASFAHVRLARERGHFAAAGYLFGRRTRAGELATAMPLPPPGGAAGAGPVPVLIADIGLQWLAGQMRALALQAGAAVIVVDRLGTVLVGVPDGPPEGRPLPAAQRALLAGADSGSSAALAHIAGGDGRRHPVGIARLPDLTVLVRLDRSGAAAAQARAAWRSYAMFALGLAAALALAVSLARQTIAFPVRRILDAIASWRSGEAAARVPVTDPRSELGRIGGALNDLLASFERTAAALRASQAELEVRVAERTSELHSEVREREQAQALLQQAQKMEVIGQLTGGVAHDFNNLLTAVIGNLELAASRSRDRPEVTRLLASAMRAAERGAALTQRMLAFGRQQYLRLQPIDLAALLDGMDDLLARSVGPTVSLRLDLQPGLWRAQADANQLELVLLNLAINGRDAMPGGGQLVIAAANETVRPGAVHPAHLDAGQYVRVAIRDAGAGMDADTLARATEPFFTTKPAGRGSGLGLSMAQGVAAQSGGALALDSAPGAGTTVSVWLPRAVQDAPGTAPHAALPPPEAPPPVRRQAPGLSVLLVDDDAEVASVTQQTLEHEGFAVTRREDGEAALALLDGGVAVDLLIADLAMPGMNGLQLAAGARARRPGLPVLLATGYADAGTVPGGADPGLPVLQKPFRAAQLLDAVAALMRTG